MTSDPQPALQDTAGSDLTARRSVYADDLQVGTVYRLGAYTVTREELLGFARHWDPQNFHIDERAAAEGHFNGLITSGIHTLAIYQRLAVQGVFDGWQVIAGRAFHDIQFVRPVRPGDTLTGTLRIDRIEPDGRGRALVVTSATLVNDQGKTVLSLTLDAYMRVRT